MHLRPRDLAIFDAIQRHGPLPSHYLFEFQKHLAKNRINFLHRLKKLTDAGYLERPITLNNPIVFTDHKVYTLAPEARNVLAAAGKKHAYAISSGEKHAHAFMTACITASIELEATSREFRFIGQEEILKRAPAADQDKPLSIPSSIAHQINGHAVRSDRPTEPDQLFGIDYGGAARFFALETDRGTEPLKRNNLDQNSIQRKFLCYQDILARGDFKKYLGIPNLFPLFITTADERVKNMVALGRELKISPTLFLFKAIPGFHYYFRTPPLLSDLFGTYTRLGDALDISKR